MRKSLYSEVPTPKGFRPVRQSLNGINKGDYYWSEKRAEWVKSTGDDCVLFVSNKDCNKFLLVEVE